MAIRTRAKVAIRSAVDPAPQPELAGPVKSATRDVNFLRSDSKCGQYVSDLSNVTPRYLVRSRSAGLCCCGWL